jgi:predicted RNase H-like nuclease (RuvC/YqgF family)
VTALDKLKEKVEGWKTRIAELEAENEALRGANHDLTSQLEQCREGGSQELEALKAESRTLADQIEAREETIVALRAELEAKDAEIEAIIAKVEALLE